MVPSLGKPVVMIDPGLPSSRVWEDICQYEIYDEPTLLLQSLVSSSEESLCTSNSAAAYKVAFFSSGTGASISSGRLLGSR